MAERIEAEGYVKMEEESPWKLHAKKGGVACGGCCGVCLLVIILIQGIMYEFASYKCNARSLVGYDYPNGGSVNLVPPSSILVEQEKSWMGESFVVLPADDVGLATGAAAGIIYRMWGPMWWTYTFQDDGAHETYMARDRPLALGGSHKIMRCDGEGPVWVVSEGSHYFMNAIRSAFGMYTSRIYNIWRDGELVAVSEKMGGTQKQMIFRYTDKQSSFASAYLSDRNYHGSFDKWNIHNDGNNTIPAFVPNMITALMAFPTADAKRKAEIEHEKEEAAKTTQPPTTMLEEAPDKLSEQKITVIEAVEESSEVPVEERAGSAVELEEKAVQESSKEARKVPGKERAGTAVELEGLAGAAEPEEKDLAGAAEPQALGGIPVEGPAEKELPAEQHV